MTAWVGLTQSLNDFVGFTLQVLALVGAILALLVVAALSVGILRSIWKVTVGKGTLVLPFSGSERGASVAAILAEQLARIEDEWTILSKRSRRLGHEVGLLERGAERPVLIDTPRAGAAGDLPMTRSEETLEYEQRGYLIGDPQQGTSLGEISIAGFRFAPDSLFAAFHRLRGLMARRTIRGNFHEFGQMARLSCTLVWPRDAAMRARRPKDKRTETRVALCRLDTPQALLEAIDDMAFLLAQARLSMKYPGREPQVDALTWRGYRAFLDGYRRHQAFALTGQLRRREEAIELYQQALAAEPGYALAHYNLATLLYNRYTAADNEEAIEHVRAASSLSFERTTRALALATLAQTYCQQVHRFGHPLSPLGSMALVASSEASSLEPDLAQTRFARGFALQILGQANEALEWFNQVLDLPETSLEVRRMKSYAHNNMGYLYLERGELDTAETHLETALELFSANKMAYTNLGEIARRRKDFATALEQYARAIELDPRYVSATNDTGVVFLSYARHARGSNGAAEHLRSANVWHERAIALIPAEAHRHRAFVHAQFAEACRDHHFPTEANRWSEDSSRETAFLAKPGRASGEADSSFLGMLGRALVARVEGHREPAGSPELPPP